MLNIENAKTEYRQLQLLLEEANELKEQINDMLGSLEMYGVDVDFLHGQDLLVVPEVSGARLNIDLDAEMCL